MKSFRRMGLAAVTATGVGLASTPAITGVAHADPEDVPFYVMGGSGLPTPSAELIDTLQALYFPAVANFAGQPTFPNVDPIALTTPEQFYPVTGIYQETLANSVSQGLQILDAEIASRLSAGEAVNVFGGSQSAVIASLEMEKLAMTDPDANASFVLIGNLMNPNGGIFERFEGLNLANLGIEFYGATPANEFPTTIYTLEYDGYADFPKYPLNILSVLNAVEGINTVHGDYFDLTPAQIASAIELPTTGATETTYYMIPVDDLPLLNPIREIPIVGNPIADLLQPNLTYLVNLGYGDPLYGYSTDPANLPTTFGLFPDFDQIAKLPALLVSGAEQGIRDFIGDFTGTGPNPVDLSFSALMESSSATTAFPDIWAELQELVSDPGGFVTDVVNTLSTSLQTAYSVLLPTADIINDLLTSLPAYNLSLFLDNLDDPISAIGLPIAATIGIGIFLANYEADVLATAAESILTSFAP